MSKTLEQVRFDFIRYANCWEDAALLVQELKLAPGARILSIASAGDNSFSLLTTGAKEVVAVDLNPVQLYLIELKKAAIQNLDREAYLQFIGFRPSKQRKEVLNTLKTSLTSEANQYWEKHEALVLEGLVHSGKFERYFQLFVRRVLPLIHSQKKVRALLADKSKAEQQQFYDRKWNTWRWKALFRIFFSRWVMGRLGRDPAFLKEVEVSVGKTIYQQAERQLTAQHAHHNWMLHYALTGEFGQHLPHYVLPENYSTVKANLANLKLVQGGIETAIQLGEKFDAFNLSNIFEYLPESITEQMGEQLFNAANPGARFAYWNLMVPRSLAALLPEKLKAGTAENHPHDRGFFYRQFHLDVAKTNR